jgi:hypothetical protein
MATEKEAIQQAEWAILHDRLAKLLDQFGKKDPVRKGDYWLVDENLGLRAQKVEIQNLRLLRPEIIKALQGALAGYSNWRIMFQVDVPGTEKTWPGMGLIIYDDEIEDDLRREYLPEEFRAIVYEGSKPLKKWP